MLGLQGNYLAYSPFFVSLLPYLTNGEDIFVNMCLNIISIRCSSCSEMQLTFHPVGLLSRPCAHSYCVSSFVGYLELPVRTNM